MNINWLGLFAVFLTLAAFVWTTRWCLKREKKKRVVLLMVAGILAIPAASFTIYYAHITPERSWYYEFRSWPFTELLVVFIGIAGGALSSLFPKILRVLPLAGVVILAVVPILKPFIGPLADGDLSDRWNENVCLQSTASTCGAASLATILNSLGTKVTEAEIAKEAHSYSGGTEAWYLARFARSKGYQAHFNFRNGFDPDMEFPAIVGVDYHGAGHFIVILEKSGDYFLVGDPLVGPERLTREELHENYNGFTGFYLSISK